MTKKQTARQRMIASAKQALAFVQGEENGCVVHISDKIDPTRITNYTSPTCEKWVPQSDTSHHHSQSQGHG